MVKLGGEVLDMFNEALPSIQNDLMTLDVWEDPNILFNMEYVSGKTNVQDYGSNFIAIHGLNRIKMIDEPSVKTGKMLTKRFSTEFDYDKIALQSLLDNLAPIAKKNDFEVEKKIDRFLRDVFFGYFFRPVFLRLGTSFSENNFPHLIRFQF